MRTDGSNPVAQACAVPFRVVGERIEFCVVTSMKRRRWMFPKGIVEPGETEAQAALKEAWEEAGLRGQIVGKSLGTYVHHKWGADIRVACFLMHVVECRSRWHESELRERRWMTSEEAIVELGNHGQRRVLAAALRALQRSRSQAG